LPTAKRERIRRRARAAEGKGCSLLFYSLTCQERVRRPRRAHEALPTSEQLAVDHRWVPVAESLDGAELLLRKAEEGSVANREKCKNRTHMLYHPPSTLGDLLTERRASFLVSRDEDLVPGRSSVKAFDPWLPSEIAVLGRVEKGLDLLAHFGESFLIVLDRRVGVALEVLKVPTTTVEKSRISSESERGKREQLTCE
jgi:hypothetical protein